MGETKKSTAEKKDTATTKSPAKKATSTTKASGAAKTAGTKTSAAKSAETKSAGSKSAAAKTETAAKTSASSKTAAATKSSGTSKSAAKSAGAAKAASTAKSTAKATAAGEAKASGAAKTADTTKASDTTKNTAVKSAAEKTTESTKTSGTGEAKSAAKASGSKSKSKSKNKKRGKWETILAVIIVVIAAVWYFSGKPNLNIYDDGFYLTQTEEPLLNKIAGKEIIPFKSDIIGVGEKKIAETETSAATNTSAGAANTSAATNSSAGAESKGAGADTNTAGTTNTSTTANAGSTAVSSSAAPATTKLSGKEYSSADADLNHSENDPLYLGNPTDAETKTSLNKNYLMVKPQYTLSYNTETLCPNWVAWHLDADDIGDADRMDDFRPDEDLPEGWYEVKKADYQYNAYGYDRGHVCPSADRTATKDDNSMTFLMTNMVPQSPDNNRVIWMHFENYERELVKQGNEVYIIAGAWGTGGTGAKGYFESIPIKTKSGETYNMNVPAYSWKVLIAIPEGKGDLDRITKDSTVIAINVPNQMGMGKTGDWEQFICSVDDIEKETGYDFFELLPDSIEDTLEAKLYQYSE